MARRAAADLVALIRATRAEGVVFLSGDVHYAEVSVLRAPGVYPLYDFVSSGRSRRRTGGTSPANGNRLDGKLLTGTNHFGRVHIDGGAAPSLTASVVDDRRRAAQRTPSARRAASRFANADAGAEQRAAAMRRPTMSCAQLAVEPSLATGQRAHTPAVRCAARAAADHPAAPPHRQPL